MDIIILSNAHTPELKQLTEQTIESCKTSDTVNFKFFIVEQQPVEYSELTLQQMGDFNYNRLMNFGIKQGNSEFIAMCNNDLLFHKGWASKITEAMNKHNLLSACPVCPNVQGNKYRQEIVYGYNIREQVSGWCIVIKRDLLKTIGEIKWHPELPFWYSDNIFMRQLQKHGIKHALVTNSIVTHIGSKTIHTKPNSREWMHDSYPKFKKLCDEGII